MISLRRLRVQGVNDFDSCSLYTMSIDRNYLRLAQLTAYKSKVNTIIESICEDGEINYQIKLNSIHDGTHERDARNRNLDGSTALHIVVKDMNVEATKKLIEHGAKCTIQNNFGETGIHEAINQVMKNFSETIKGQVYHSIIDTMLDTHVCDEISENPCNNNGLSHFHAACIVDYSDVVKYFIEGGVSVHEAIVMSSPYVPGYTALHFAARYSCLETFKILLDNGAEVQVKDAKGLSPLHLLIQRNMEIADYIHLEKKVMDDCMAEEFNKNEEMIKLALEEYKSIRDGILDDIELSYVHVACVSHDVSYMVQLLFDEDIELDHCIKSDSKLWPGYTALHFAAHTSLTIVKVLLTNGANILAKDADGLTPLDLCLQRYPVEDIYFIVKKQKSWRNVVLSDNSTLLLDMIYAMRSENSLEIFVLEVPVTANIPTNCELWPGYTSLHLAIMLADKVQGDFTLSLERIRILLTAGADVTAQDSSATTPIHLAFHQNKPKIVKLLLEGRDQPIYDCITLHGISHLHVACAVGDLEAAKKIFCCYSSIINLPLKSHYEFEGKTDLEAVNYFFTAGSTPLHIAVITRNVELTELLVGRGAHVDAKDAKGMTPIHRLLRRESDLNPPLHYFRRDDDHLKAKALGTILFSSDCLKDYVTSFGLSYLHIACWLNDELAVEKLLDQGANVNVTLLTVAPEGDDDIAYKQMRWFSSHSYETPLYFALIRANAKVIDLIFRRYDDIAGTPTTILSTACYTKKSTSINALQKTHAPMMERWEKEFNITPLHAACYRYDVAAAEKMLKQGANPNARVFWNSLYWPGLTPLHIVTQYETIYQIERLNSIVKLLIAHGADVMMRNPAGNTALHQVARSYDMKKKIGKPLVIMLLNAQKIFYLNPTMANKGISHFHLACSCNLVTIVERYLKHDADVNQVIDPLTSPFYQGYTPLHLAAYHKCKKIVDLLLKNGADVHARNREDETPLHCAVNYESFNRIVSANDKKIREDVIKSLLAAGADLSATNIWGQTPLEILLKTTKPNAEILSILTKSERCVNSFNTNGGTGFIAIAIQCETSIKNIFDHPVYQAVIDSPRLDETECGRTPIHNIVSIRKIAASVNIYTKAIEGFLNAGYDIDQQDEKGQTALHTAVRFRNAKGVAALLALGANINLYCQGETPFSYQWALIENISLDVTKLLESDRRILKLLANQVYKLQLINLPVTRIDQTTETTLRRCQWNLDLTVVEKCQIELERLEYRKIEPYDITLHNFLSETGVIASYPNMTQHKRETVDNFFQNYSFRLRQGFPELAGILRMQYRKTVTRMSLIEPAKDALCSMLNFSFPDLCSSLILRFLKNSELENLIKSEEYLLAPMPRRRKID